MEYSFGIDVGGTGFKTGLFDSEGKMLYKKTHPTVNGENGKILFDDIAASVEEAKTTVEKEYQDAFKNGYPCLGIGIPGPLINESYITKLPNIDIENTDIREELNKRIPGMEVYAMNDANAAALGEKWQGAGKGYDSVLMVTLGTGVGGGLVLGDKIISGIHGAGGEIGHIHVEDKEIEACGCGGYGCLEQFASATGLCRIAKRKMKRALEEKNEALLSSGLFNGEITSGIICKLAGEGDRLSNEVLDEGMHYLGKGLSAVAAVFDPEVYIIGGGVAGSFEILLPRIEKSLRKYTSIIKNGEFRIVHAKLGNDAGMYGAAKYALTACYCSDRGSEKINSVPTDGVEITSMFS